MATQNGVTQLTLRIDLEADPITGSLSSAHGPSRRFSGWIGLVAALEAVRTEPPVTENPAVDRSVTPRCPL